MSQKKITYCLVNNLGGIATMLRNVIQYGGQTNIEQEVIILNVKENKSTGIIGTFCEGIDSTMFNFSNKENWYHLFGRLARLTGNSSGVMVINDVYEMLMLSHFSIPKKVIQIIHDGYNVKLALQYGDVADAFICHSFFFYEVMCQLFPERRNDIFFIPYGVPLSGYRRKTGENNEPLKLFYLGRHDKEKGIFDLIEIENQLKSAGVPTDWLILGKGPQTAILKEQWKHRNNVLFEAPPGNDEVLQQITKRDVLVFPTRFEGFPVALVEAMSVGCVPVASNLPGGIRELIRDEKNGFLCDYKEIDQFVKRIEWLHLNRSALEEMSNNAAAAIAVKYDAVNQSPKYQLLFEKIAMEGGSPRHHSVKRKIGSRLDQPWLPGFVTEVLRRKYNAGKKL